MNSLAVRSLQERVEATRTASVTDRGVLSLLTRGRKITIDREAKRIRLYCGPARGRRLGGLAECKDP